MARRSDAPRRKAWKHLLLGATVGVLALAQGTPTVDANFAAFGNAFASAHFRGLGQQHSIATIPQSHYQGGQQSHGYASRRLDANATVNDAVNKANEIGASVRKAVKQLRGGTDKFYRDLITAFKITMCDNLVSDTGNAKNPKNRFVDANDDRAYKDSDDKCVKVVVNANTDTTIKDEYNQGHCEVKPNCYWGPIEATDVERRPVYAETEAALPLDGAMTKQGAKDMLMKWAQGLMIFVVPGIILGVLSLLTMIFFLLCRCCCNRCGGRSPKEGGYTCMQKFWPLFFFLLFAIGVVVVAGVSLLYQKTVTSAVSDTFQAASDTLGDASGWIVNVRTPMENIRDKVVVSADKIKVELAGTDFIETGIDGLTGKLEDFGSYSAGRTLPTGCTQSESEPFCLPCVVCTTISTEVGKATTEISNNAGDGIAQLKSVRTSLNTMLVDIADSVKNTVDSQVDMSNTLITTVDDVRTQVDDIQEQYEKQKAPQQAGVLALFALALVVIVIGFVGILFGLTPLKFLANIIHIAYVIGFIALFITFVVSALFLAISVVLGDVCEVTMIFTEDWTMPLGDAAKGVNACFSNESLIETFNLSSSLEFARGGIEFPDGLDMNSMLDFSELDTFATTIKATDASTFRLNETVMDEFLDLLNKYTKQSKTNCKPNDDYSIDDVLDPWTANGDTKGSDTAEEYIKARYTGKDADCGASGDGEVFACSQGQTPCEYSDFVVEVYHNVSMLAMVKRDSTQFITDLHTNITVVTDYTDDFKDKTKDLDAAIQGIRTDLESSLIKYVGDFENAMYCTFISDGFFEIYDALCGKLMPAFTMISLMLFLAGVFLFPVNVCLIIACKRLKARGNGGHVMDNEMKFK